MENEELKIEPENNEQNVEPTNENQTVEEIKIEEVEPENNENKETNNQVEELANNQIQQEPSLEENVPSETPSENTQETLIQDNPPIENENNDIQEQPVENIQQPEPENIENNVQEPIPEENVQQDQPVQENQQPEQTNNNPQPTEQKKKSKVGLIIGIVVGVIIIGLVLFYVLAHALVTKREVVNRGVSLMFNDARTAVKAAQASLIQYDLDKDSLGVTGDIQIDTNYKDNYYDLSKLKDYQLNYKAVIDKKGNKASGGIALTKSNKDFIKADGYIEGKSAYFTLNELSNNQVLKTELDQEIKDLELSSSTNFKDIDRLLEKTEKIVAKNISDEDIKESKETKEFLGKKATYRKIEYSLNVNKLGNSIIEEYSSDDEIIKILANLTQKKESEIKEAFESFNKNSSDNDYSSEDALKINVYLKGLMNNVAAYEFVDDTDSLLLINDKNSYKIIVTSDNKETLSGEYNTKDKTLVLKSKEGITIKGTFKPGNTLLNINFVEDDTELNIDADIKNKVTANSQTNEATVKVDIKEGKNSINATVTSRMKLEKNMKIDKLSTTGAVDIEKIPEEQLNGLYMKVYEKIGQITNEIMPNYNPYASGFEQFKKII